MIAHSDAITSTKTYKSQLKKWGFSKKSNCNKAHTYLRVPSPSKTPVSQSDCQQSIIITQMRQLLVESLETTAWTWGPGPYGNSNVGISVANIIQGNLLVKRGHTNEGFLLVRRGFNTIDQVFHKHTLHALLDMLIHLHMYCDNLIIQHVWRYLSLYSGLDSVPDTGRRLHATLAQLKELSMTGHLSYKEVLLSMQAHIYNEFRQQGAHQDPSLLAMMANGVAPHLSMAPWKGSDWKDFLISSLDEMRRVLRDSHGIHHEVYHSWMWRHLGSIRNLCGEDSDTAFELAMDIDKELEELQPTELRLLPECWLTMGQYHWKMLGSVPDLSNPRIGLAIDLLNGYTMSRWSAGARNDAELGWLHLLESWQRVAGREAEADETLKRCTAMVEEIAEGVFIN